MWVTEAQNKKRKLKYTLQIIEDKKSKVGVNTHLTNKIVLDALERNLIKDFSKNVKIVTEHEWGFKTEIFNLLEDTIVVLLISISQKMEL